jgi:hypothetical protein
VTVATRWRSPGAERRARDLPGRLGAIEGGSRDTLVDLASDRYFDAADLLAYAEDVLRQRDALRPGRGGAAWEQYRRDDRSSTWAPRCRPWLSHPLVTSWSARRWGSWSYGSVVPALVGRGYEAGTLEDVAASLDLRRASLYHYFRSLTALALLGMMSWIHKWYEPGRHDAEAYARTCEALLLGPRAGRGEAVSPER